MKYFILLSSVGLLLTACGGGPAARATAFINEQINPTQTNNNTNTTDTDTDDGDDEDGGPTGPIVPSNCTAVISSVDVEALQQDGYSFITVSNNAEAADLLYQNAGAQEQRVLVPLHEQAEDAALDDSFCLVNQDLNL